MSIRVYHNPKCGTSRTVLALLEERGEAVEVVEYLKTPPAREELKRIIARSGQSVRHFLRQRGTPYEELGLGDESLSDDQLLDAMMAHPILINRPIVVTDMGVALCRPADTVLSLL